MTVFSITHPDKLAELRIDATDAAGADGLTLCLEAPGGRIALSAPEVDLLSDALLFWIIGDAERTAAIRIEN